MHYVFQVTESFAFLTRHGLNDYDTQICNFLADFFWWDFNWVVNKACGGQGGRGADDREAEAVSGPFHRRPAAAPPQPTFATFPRDLLGFLPHRVIHFITEGPGWGLLGAGVQEGP